MRRVKLIVRPRLAALALGIAAGAVIYWDLSRRGWASVMD